jgi:hypothetical protein
MSSYFGSSNSIRHASDCPCDDCSLAGLPSSSSQTTSSATPATKDTPTISLKSTMTRLQHISLKTGSRTGRGFSGLKPVRAKLYSTLFGAISAATAALTVNSNVTLTAGNFPEIASWMTVYDEMRIIKGALHYSNWIQIQASANPNLSFGAIAIMFDGTAAAPTTVDGVMQETFSRFLTPLSGASIASAHPTMHKLDFNVGKPLVSLTSNDMVGSSWFTLDSTSAPSMAVVHLYATDGGTNAVTGLKYVLEFDVEFRMRT